MNTQGKVWGLTQHIFAHNDVSIHRVEIVPGGTCSKHLHEHKWNANWRKRITKLPNYILEKNLF